MKLLSYMKGCLGIENVCIYVFRAHAKNWARDKLLDTRKGFRIKYQPSSHVVGIKLNINCERGLLCKITGNDTTDAEVFQTN